MGENVGYLRVSTTDQSTARQLDGVELDLVFEDKASGSNTDRPQLQACLKYVRKGDTLHVHSIDRLARNLQDLLDLVTKITEKGVCVRFHKESLAFGCGDDNAMNVLMLSLLGAVAAFERSLIRERQAEGIAKARQAGKHLGRARKLSPDQEQEIRRLVAAGEEKKELAARYGVSRQMIYEILLPDELRRLPSKKRKAAKNPA